MASRIGDEPFGSQCDETDNKSRKGEPQMREHGLFASQSVFRHIARGVTGFGLIGSAFALAASVSPIALLLAPLGMVALRGCPMCWTIGLIETISAGRLKRTCTESGCALHPSGHKPT